MLPTASVAFTKRGVACPSASVRTEARLVESAAVALPAARGRPAKASPSVERAKARMAFSASAMERARTGSAMPVLMETETVRRRPSVASPDTETTPPGPPSAAATESDATSGAVTSDDGTMVRVSPEVVSSRPGATSTAPEMGAAPSPVAASAPPPPWMVSVLPSKSTEFSSSALSERRSTATVTSL